MLYRNSQPYVTPEIPFASVLICAHNHLEDLTLPCIEALQENTSYPYELILIDDGSNDGSIRHFEMLTGKAARLTKRRGVSVARNVGLEMSSGDPIVTLDNDVTVIPGWLTVLAGESTKEKVGIIGAIPSNEIERFLAPISPDGLIDFPHVSGACMGIVRHCFDVVGYFDETLINNGEDTDFCYRAKERGFRVVSTPEVILPHDAGATRRELDRREMERSSRTFRQKYRNADVPLPPEYPF